MILRRKPTSPLGNERSLHNSSTIGGFTECDLIYDSIFFDNSPTGDAEAVPRCMIIFNYSPSTIGANSLGKTDLSERRKFWE